ncbi:GDSL-type esterase/lipase family protein [Bacillus canaveralius]|uniref:GDSL-type esterase/lipase family protein n=1 Tax=Bacillus canaveralius TaxID=1403243 RepID=UPI00163AA78F|nr:GDSL-type esterase/lipase family protein [Bacillus canaveralius]
MRKNLKGISLLLLLSGFVWTIQNPDQESIKEAITADKDGKHIVAIGDSLTRGYGDSNGKGYPGYLVEHLQQKSKDKITLQNLGVSRSRTDQWLDLIKQEKVQRQVEQADVILMTIGANDLFQEGKTINNFNTQTVDELRKQYLVNLQEILTELRTLNAQAPIFFIGLYNPLIDTNNADLITRVVRQWNYETTLLIDKYHKTVFVPVFDLFQSNVNDYLYKDKFHPNTKGYKLIAKRITPLVEKGA